MTKSTYNDLITGAITACQNRNADDFTSLFTVDAQIQLDSQTNLDRSQIYPITKDYFKQLKFIKIDVIAIAINEGEKTAFIEWVWTDFNLQKDKENSHQNTIVLEFKDNLIYRWREYRMQNK